MKYFGLLAAFLVLMPGCVSEPPTTREYMIISQKNIVFSQNDSIHHISITHSCTCPFSWTAHLNDTSVHWLEFPIDSSSAVIGDHNNIFIGTYPSLYTKDTNDVTITVISNNYGSDTIHV